MNTDSDYKHYLALISVRFKVPMEMIDRATGIKSTSAGYFVKIGITIPPYESTRRAITLLVKEGEIVWSESTVEDISWDEMDDELRANSKGFGQERVWFYGSEFYCPPTENEKRV